LQLASQTVWKNEPIWAILQSFEPSFGS